MSELIKDGVGYRINGQSTGTLGQDAVNLSKDGSCWGKVAFAEGYKTLSSGENAHAEGFRTTASGIDTHAEGSNTRASGFASHSQGSGTSAQGDASSASGMYTRALSTASNSIGSYNVGTSMDTIFEVGIGPDDYNRKNGLEIYRDGRVVAPELTSALINSPQSLITKEYFDTNSGGGETPTPVEGYNGLNLVSEDGTRSGWILGANNGRYSGNPIGEYSVDFTWQDQAYPTLPQGATGDNAFATGRSTLAQGFGSVSFGDGTKALGKNSATFGLLNTSTADYSFSSGRNNTVDGLQGLAGGINSTAQGDTSFVFGDTSVAQGTGSLAIGTSTVASQDYQIALGKFNLNKTDTILEVGTGLDNNSRQNVLEAYINSSPSNLRGAIVAPMLSVQTIRDSVTDKILITKEYMDTYGGGGSGDISTGLKAFDEGNGLGWRLVGRNTDGYAPIGLNAVDFSYNPSSSPSTGASGQESFAMGYQARAETFGSVVFGEQSRVFGVGQNSIALGVGNQVSATNSTAIGFQLKSLKNSTKVVVGRTNVDTNGTQFEVGIGQSFGVNALEVFDDGRILAPSLDKYKISAPKSLVTKEFLQNNGSLSARPSSPSIGEIFFDTDLGLPTWFDGIHWIDAVGNDVTGD